MYIPVQFSNDVINPREMEINDTTFRDLKLQERHLEEYIRRNIGDILDSETLLIVGQQVRNTAQGISDLTAVDGEGNIVLIEIKRDVNDIVHRREPFEMQAIRYAAGYAKVKTAEELVDLVCAVYVEWHKDEYDLRHLTSAELARRELNEFLERNEASRTFNQKQRILLIASEFDEQTLSAVAWLIQNKVDISCITITPVFIGDESFLQVERLLPPRSLDDFYVELVEPGQEPVVKARRKSSGSRAFLPRMNKLFEWGIVKPGDRLSIKGYPGSTAEIIDHKKVNYRDQTMSPYEWGKQVTGWSSINIYEWAILDRVGKTLHELRLDKMEELAAEGTQ